MRVTITQTVYGPELVRDVEWPCVPRVGDHVQLGFGYTDPNGVVREVGWFVHDDGTPVVRVMLQAKGPNPDSQEPEL